MQLSRKQRLIFMLFAAVVLAGLCLWVLSTPEEPAGSSAPLSSSMLSEAEAQPMEVWFFDVEQADAALFRSPDGKTLLIDAGDTGTKESLTNRIRELGITRLDIVVATHPHSDHIGGMREVIEAFEIGSFYLPNAPHTSKTYTNMLDDLAEKQVSVYEAKSGGHFMLGSEVSCTILGPTHAYEDLNDASAVIRVAYGSTSFLMTGDAETPAEEDMLAAHPTNAFTSTLLKMGHHGSSTSSCPAFLDAAAPAYAIISCGMDNDYGHPNAETLERLAARKILTYRTDLLGEIYVTSDGSELFFDKPGQIPESEAQAMGYVYVTNSGTTYHKEDCSSLSKSKNRISYDQAVQEGYTPCKRCFE